MDRTSAGFFHRILSCAARNNDDHYVDWRRNQCRRLGDLRSVQKFTIELTAETWGSISQSRACDAQHQSCPRPSQSAQHCPRLRFLWELRRQTKP
ncbi:hypothetical protein RRG08_020010 [Elysia crispata]|uniref:Uncharacterized protein n=1 Tax=Elysia crispata TaxID=231223 RepID=A0AAE1BBD2_9GAST|nr:hypothetical protein RRG08_020010 [Elysia crispata]